MAGLDIVKTLLSQLTGKKNIVIMRRGNVAIRQALRIAVTQGFNSVTIQDQGGWITYEQYANQLKLPITKIETDTGFFTGNFSKELLLINTMPGYAGLVDTASIKTSDCFIINDATGSIGTPQGTWGDIIVASFGEDKPIYLGKYALFASDIDYHVPDEVLLADEIIILAKLIERLPITRKELNKASDAIKKDLKDLSIVHSKAQGFNVIIKTTNNDEENRIKDYCAKHGYEFTICPRYIRMLDRGISIEVKRVVKQN